jgi:RNA polymerase sigma-70 factor (ECF subfamily)
MAEIAADSSLGRAWHANRAYLVDLGYRMLGDVGAAEDVVQEAFLRLDLADPTSVRNPRAWLTVVTSRLCLDQIRSKRPGMEHPAETSWLDGALSVDHQAFGNPADRITLDDQVRQALMLMLERLRPAERVAFVLHDVFQVPFSEVAEILGQPATTCRQLAKRARAKLKRKDVIQRDDTHQDASGSELHQLSQAFLEACANGNLEALTGLLHPDVWGVADFALGDPPHIRPRRGEKQVQHGADVVARSLLQYFGGDVTLVSTPATSGLAFLGFVNRRRYADLLASVSDGRITSIHVVVHENAMRTRKSSAPSPPRRVI